jgi:uncharacterized protein (TIGR03067 family)
MSRCFVVVVMVLGLSPALADEKDELAKFDGTWVGVSATQDGKEVPKAEAESMRLTVSGEKYTFKVGDTEAEGTHKLDPTRSPKQIEAVRTKGPHAGEKMLGIYELTGDTYRVCFAAPGKTERPTEFKSAAGSGHRLIVMKRQKG